MSWREASFNVINSRFIELRREYPDAPAEELLRKISREDYPFGPREHHPYKMWLKVMREYRAALKDSGSMARVISGRSRRKVPPAARDQNQARLFSE